MAHSLRAGICMGSPIVTLSCGQHVAAHAAAAPWSPFTQSSSSCSTVPENPSAHVIKREEGNALFAACRFSCGGTGCLLVWYVQMAAFGGAWMPAVGNVAVALAVVLALALNLALTGGADAAVFAICPLLLLLNQDVYLLTSYGDRQRYFPLAAAIAVNLTASSVWFLLDSLALASTLGFQQYLTVLKNLIALLFTLPLHYLFNRFLYDGTRAADMTLLCLAPLNLPPLLLADTSSVQWLAGIALVQGVAQYVMSRRVHLTGLRYI